ncbi:MAG: TetR/AcrR family transcriptional regulator [Actinomycetota bacterium]|jgi:AcrR family transcriptional regulator|nr:TetR/AcrR family transcriptional regulator [Actinomycetota bacterium]MDA3015680.1 TetR/AcrR family transcriptional regulator [Actinomycetota bacterium]MDA3027548.1 TetR/AcrR family transcriptional regulator [Actinomycetota bacterium]
MTHARLTAAARREQILDVALEIFGRSGYHGASMNEIAEAAGVTKPVLYQHFDSKSDLFSALLDEVGTRMRTAISKATADADDGKSQTRLGFLAYFRWVATDHDGFRLLFGGAARHDAEFTEQVRRITSDAASAIAPLIAVDLDPERRRIISHALVGLAEGASRRLLDKGTEFDPDEIAATVSALAWAGLRALNDGN